MTRTDTIFSFLLLVLLLAPSSHSLAADSLDHQIHQIQTIYQEVNQLTPKLKEQTINLFGYSTEGTEAKVLSDKTGKVRKIIATHFGEMGRAIEEYYYDKKGALCFVFKQVQQYNAHIMESVNNNTKIKVIKTDEHRFYFVNNKLIQWLDPNKISISSKNEQFTKNEKLLLEFSNKMIKEFQKSK